jgi:hypothetical protein
MLRARIVQTSIMNKLPVIDLDEEGEMSVDEIVEHAKRINGLPYTSSYPGGIVGDHGFITVQGNEFILHAYFVDRNEILEHADIQIELFSPMAYDEKSKSYKSQGPDIYGNITLENLKALLFLIDENKTPIEYAQSVVKQRN